MKSDFHQIPRLHTRKVNEIIWNTITTNQAII